MRTIPVIAVLSTLVLNARGAAFTVTSTADSGPGTLRQAILDANAFPASANHTIVFDLPGPTPAIIQPTTLLPSITRPVTIDGFTQNGSRPNTLSEGSDAVWGVTLDGSLITPRFTADGLQLNAPGSMVRGLRITGLGNNAILLNTGASNCVIAGNCLAGNGNAGVTVSNSFANRIGGSAPADHNLISANPGYGVFLEGADCEGNSILGNLIGPDATGVQGNGDQSIGVFLFQASGNSVGGLGAQEANIIAFNSSYGVFVSQGSNNVIRANRIFNNGGKGIGLLSSSGGNGDSNDPGDADTGGNQLQNYPVLSDATASAGSTLIEGHLNSRPNQTYTLDFYTTAEDCTSFYGGQGEFYLGSAPVTTDGSGDVDFSVTVPATIQRHYVVATATDTNGNTSQFSGCIPAHEILPAPTLTVTSADDAGVGTLRQALMDAGDVPGTGVVSIHFALPGSGVQVITPLSPLPTPTVPVNIDGYTQPNAAPNTLGDADNAVLLIQLDGTIAGGTGLELGPSNCTVRGLSITHFDNGVYLGASGSIKGCWVGVTPAGAPAGNKNGVVVIGNSGLLGGTAPADRNVISANTADGVLVADIAAQNNLIQGNFIGTDATGSRSLGNAGNGIHLQRAPNNQVGSTNPAAANFISGNGGNGILIEKSSAANNVVVGNFIGTDRNLGLDLGNGQNGVFITGGAHDNAVGTFDPSSGNTIANSLFDAVVVDSGHGNGILNNIYYNNGAKDIHVFPGANDNLQPPQLESANQDTGGLTVKGTVMGMPATTYQVQIYREIPPMYWLSGSSNILGTVTVTTDELGKATFQRHFDELFDPASILDATITAPNNSTSEFSDGIYLKRAGTVDIAVKYTVPGSISEGATAVLSGSVQNLGPEDAANVEAQSIIPPGSTFLSAASPDGACTFNNGIVTCELGFLRTNQVKTFNVNVRMNFAGQTETTLVGNALGQVEGLFFNNQQRERIYVIPSSGDADLAITMAGGGVVPDGTVVPITVTVSNLGPGAASSAKAVLDSDTLLFLPEIGTPTQGTATRDLLQINWQIGSLPPGGSAQLPVNLDVLWLPNDDSDRPWSSQSYRARASASTQDPLLDNNIAEAHINVIPPYLNHTFEPSQKQLTLSYPAGSVNAQLEFATDLAAPIQWQPWPAAGVVSNGQVYFSISTQPPSAESFFRLNSTAAPPVLPDLKLYQMDLTLDNVRHPFSDWGQVKVTFLGHAEAQYLNVNIDGNWVIKNVPLLSQQGPDVVQSVSLNVPLGQYGAPKTQALVGWSLLTNPVSVLPEPASNTQVGILSIVDAAGTQDSNLYYRPPEPLVGGLVSSNATALPSFPNFEQGINECTPIAVLNSLVYLNQVFGLNLPSDQLTTNAMKIATAWGVKGSPVVWLDNVVWVQRKRNYMTQHHLPIVTEETHQPGLVLAALRNHYDVEIGVAGHTAAVVGIAAQTNGLWTLLLQDDQRQGEDGGLHRYAMTYDPESGYVLGTEWSKEFVEFVVERPGP